MDDHPQAHGATQKPATAKPVFNHQCEPHITAQIESFSGIHAFLGLHTLVKRNLPPEKRHYVKTRYFKDLKDHVESGHKIIAIYSGTGEMIAQALVSFPDKAGASNIGGYPFDKTLTPQNSVIIQAVGVHPAHKGCKLPEKLFAEAERIAAKAGRPHVVAKMDASNAASFKVFDTAKYKIKAQYTVDGEGYESLFMVKTLPTMAQQATSTHKNRFSLI